MSRENVEVIEQAVAAINARDLDGYLSWCAPDIELHITPLAAIGAVYEGPMGIRRWFTDLEDVGPDFRLELERAETIRPGRVLAFLRVTGSGRASGLQVGRRAGGVADVAAERGCRPPVHRGLPPG
jgi:hypothetical protein